MEFRLSAEMYGDSVGRHEVFDGFTFAKWLTT